MSEQVTMGMEQTGFRLTGRYFGIEGPAPFQNREGNESMTLPKVLVAVGDRIYGVKYPLMADCEAVADGLAVGDLVTVWVEVVAPWAQDGSRRLGVSYRGRLDVMSDD